MATDRLLSLLSIIWHMVQATTPIYPKYHFEPWLPDLWCIIFIGGPSIGICWHPLTASWATASIALRSVRLWSVSLVPLILILSKVINTPKWNPGKPSICLVWFLLLENHWNPYFIKLFKAFLNLSYSCQLLFLWSCSLLPQLSFTPIIAPKFRLINLYRFRLSWIYETMN